MKYTEKKVGKYTVDAWEDGDKVWYYEGKLHRENGPAWEYADGDTEWWLNNKLYSEEEWTFEMRKRKLKELGI